jgi:hypothetical protein
LKLGRVREGLALLDESMISVVTGEVWHPVAGNIYCSMIDACLEVSDLRRADEWTTALAAWWARQPDLVTFTGQCLIHRAEIMQLHGAWPEAVEETRRACERLAHAADRYTTGAGSTGRQRFTASAAILPPPRTPSGRPLSGGTTLSPAWPCSGWPRETPRRPLEQSAASSPRPPTG